MANPEQAPLNNEQALSPETGKERLEQLSEATEQAAEQSSFDREQSEASARAEAMDTALSVEARGAEQKRDVDAPSPPKRKNTRKARKENFKKEMKQIQSEMKPGEKAFSKTIHNPVVENMSEGLAATIARPNAILAGSVTAFALTLGVYLVAKSIGYQLSGAESILSFVIGWLIGLIYDFLRVMITGKKH